MTKSKIKKSYDRILKISDDAQQITLPDSRYYKHNGEYYPSITYVLQYYPKGHRFEDWLKKVGYASEYIVKKASEEGIKVHEMIEEYLNGETLYFLDEKLNPKFHPDIWEMFLRFVEFWEKYKPTLIDTEVSVYSHKYKVAGTIDMLCEMNGELWVIDFKTSNQLHTTQELQVAIYGQCYEECFGKKPDRYGILWLKSSKHKHSQTKIQGPGWELHESIRTQEENLDIFLTVKKLFDLENPEHKPIFTKFPTVIKRKFSSDV